MNPHMHVEYNTLPFGGPKFIHCVSTSCGQITCFLATIQQNLTHTPRVKTNTNSCNEYGAGQCQFRPKTTWQGFIWAPLRYIFNHLYIINKGHRKHLISG